MTLTQIMEAQLKSLKERGIDVASPEFKKSIMAEITPEISATPVRNTPSIPATPQERVRNTPSIPATPNAQMLTSGSGAAPEPRTPGIPEGTVRAVPEHRNQGMEGFAGGLGRPGPEKEVGKLTQEAKKSSLAPDDKRKDMKPGTSAAAPMDRKVPGASGLDPERNGTPPGRAYKAAPRRSVYLPH